MYPFQEYIFVNFLLATKDLFISAIALKLALMISTKEIRIV